MTYAHYQQLQAFAKKRIADKLAEIQPRAGNLVSVVGDGISIEPPRPDPIVDKTPTWVLTLYTRYRTQSMNAEWGDWTSWEITSWAPREEGGIGSGYGPAFWLFYRSVNKEGDTIAGQNLEVDFQIRISETEAFRDSVRPITPFEKAKYLYPINLVIEEWYYGYASDRTNLIDPIVVKTYSLTLKRAGQKRTFTPYEPGKIYRVRPVAFRRL